MTRDELVAYARGLDGLGAAPARGREHYLDLIAPGEPPAKRAGMARMSGCALVARGILRELGARHPVLAAPYVIGRAMTDLVTIARADDALRGPERAPEPGDLVIVGGGADGGGPEHVWMHLGAGEGLDGGQRDDEGYQVIRLRQHELSGGWDSAHDDQAGWVTRRRVRWVIDVERVLVALG